MGRAVLVVACSAALAAAAVDAAPHKGDGPNQIVTGYGAVWVGTGGGAVIRIDPARYRVVWRRDLSFTAVQRIVPAYGAMWVATGTGLLQRIDAATGRVRELWTRDVCTSRSLAVAAGAVWTLDFHHNRLCRVDPRSNRFLRRVSLGGGGEPLTIWSDGRRVWLATNVDPKPPMVEDNLEHVRLVSLDPDTGTAAGTTIDTAGWVDYSSGFGSLWSSDPIAESLARLDFASGRVLAVRSGVSGISAPVAGYGSLWLPLGDRLERLDPYSLNTVAEIPVAAFHVAVGAGGVWVLDLRASVVRKVDPATNHVVGRPVSVTP